MVHDETGHGSRIWGSINIAFACGAQLILHSEAADSKVFHSTKMRNPVTDFTLFGFTVAAVLSSPYFLGLPRDLKLLEVWAGLKRCHRAAVALGLPADTVEIEDDSVHQDMTTRAGFEYALTRVMRLAVGGLLVLTPVCSSFVFANMSHTHRNKNNYSGDETYWQVRDGNAMARAAVFLVLLAHHRELFAYLENPAGSMFFNYEYVKWVLNYLMQELAPGKCWAVIYLHCPYMVAVKKGKRPLKRFKIVAIGGLYDWVAALDKPCPCGAKGHIRLMPFNKRGKPSGNVKALKASQGYSQKLGTEIVKLWQEAVGHMAHAVPDMAHVVPDLPVPVGKQRPMRGAPKPVDDASQPVVGWQDRTAPFGKKRKMRGAPKLVDDVWQPVVGWQDRTAPCRGDSPCPTYDWQHR